MQTITILRYSAATTKAAILREIASGRSKDHGTGDVFDGICCAIEAGQIVDVQQFVSAEYMGGTYTMPNGYQLQGRAHKLDLNGAIDTASGVAGYLASQGCSKRTMWRLTVTLSEIVGTCGRSMGGLVPCYEADGVVLAQTAQPVMIEKVAL